MQRCILLLLAVGLCPSLALARTWTNRQGKEIIADFVDATEEKVTLKKSDGKTVTFKLDLLCEDDQNFIRGILARRVGKQPAATGDASDSPFEAVTPAPASAPADLKTTIQRAGRGEDDEEAGGLGTMRDVNETKKKTKPENRQWTDAFGNKTSGKFIRFVGNNVLVLRSGRQVSLDYWQLSDEDKDYLNELCEANGWSQFIPKVNPAERRSAPGANIAGPGVGLGPSSAPNMPVPGAFAGPTPGVSQPGPGPSSSPPSLPSGTSDPEALARRIREIEENARSATFTPPASATAGSSTFPSTGGTAGYGPSSMPPPSASAGYGPSSTPSSGPPPGAFGSPAMGSAMPSSSMPGPASMPGPSSMPSFDPTPNLPTFSMEKQCGSCGKVLPASFTAGDSCPGCGVYFSHDDTNGKRANPGFFGGGGGGGGMSRGAIKGIIVLVVLGIKGFAYMVWRSQRS
jgi:hypothetical protein